MKKTFLLFVFLGALFTAPIQAQTLRPVVPTDSVKISRVDLDKFFASVDSIQAQNKIMSDLINNYRQQLGTLQYIRTQDSLLTSYKERQIALMKEEITLHQQRVKKLEQGNWKQTLSFLSGAAAILVSSMVLRNLEGRGL